MSDNDPQVAVLLPARENDPYLGAALQSLQSQTYRNWFCYLIADGDSRATAKLASDELANGQFRIFDYPIKKRGLAAGLNFGLRVINQDLVARFDSDDLCLPKRLAEQVQALTNRPGLVMACSPSKWVNSSGQEAGASTISASTSRLPWQLGWFNPVTHSSVIYRRQAVMAEGGYNPLARGCEDYDLWLRLLSNKARGVMVSQEPLVLYRKHDAQLTTKSMVGQQIRVIKASRLRYFKAENPDFNTLSAGVKSTVWATWQRLRFP